MFRASVHGINIIIETDEPMNVASYLSYMYDAIKFSPFHRKMIYDKVKGHIYNRKMKDKNTGTTFFEVGIGWSSYLLAAFGNVMLQSDYEEIVNAMRRPTYRTLPFPELRPHQNEDILHLLRFRRGLFSVFTGYGKSQCISVLSNEFKSQGKKILLVTPSLKARDELVKRIKSLYGYSISLKLGEGQVQAIITNGILNKKSMKDPVEKEKIEKELSSFDVVLCDECEYCMNPGGFFIFDHCTGAEYCFGFSGTAEKSQGKMITLKDGINNSTVAGNKDLIKYFGPSLVYRLPAELEVNNIIVRTESMNNSHLKLWEVINDDSKNIYNDVMNRIFTDDEVCKSIVKIAKTFPNLFIPINNLHSIIYNWIDNYFLKKFRILLVCNEGYIYYDLEGNKTKLTLQEACQKIKDEEVDVIPSTSSGFRALDFPNLRNILLFSGKIAGSVLQQIGRVARQKVFNIISLDPLDRKTLPIHTKGQKVRAEMIKEYYSQCIIRDIELLEVELKKYKGIK